MESTSSAAAPIVLSADAIAAIRAEPLGKIEGVSHRVVWRNEAAMAGVMRVEAGHRLGTHSHHLNHHHMWVLDGHAVILGAELGPGSYVHVPRGVDHDIDATGSEGCTVFYLYLPPGE